MIPKIIHYCWFGGNPLGNKELKCINSWKHFFPGYEIVEWNESNFDTACCRYVQQAFENKKWAFVSDYARFRILYEYGGLYFDTDVEVIKSFEDIVANGPFMGFEADPTQNKRPAVNPGLGLAAYAGMELYRSILRSYEEDSFILDGLINYQTVVERTTKLLEGRGLDLRTGIQVIDGISIYPSEYFNPIDPLTGEKCITQQTRSIHNYGASWQPKSWRRVGMIKRNLSQQVPFLPVKLRSPLAWLLYLVESGDFKSFLNRYS